ncbi:hypothetical protein B6D60_06065 [candidate division KSB1 bacterium 4484_87]|nr:MAG: hypothetical protein B6D60_06065 [candidate division KSB1 bacterium 4484_87]
MISRCAFSHRYAPIFFYFLAVKKRNWTFLSYLKKSIPANLPVKPDNEQFLIKIELSEKVFRLP